MRGVFTILLFGISFFMNTYGGDVHVIKNVGHSHVEFRILSLQSEGIDPDHLSYYGDTTYYQLNPDQRYYFELTVFDSLSFSNSISLSINKQPVMIFKDGIDCGLHLYPFHTGTKVRQLKIIGGSDADIEDFPWQVYLQAGTIQCGGSIISEKWILTAAHCVLNERGGKILPSRMAVKVGTANPYDSDLGRIYYVREAIPHEDYNNISFENDIAVLELTEPIDFENAEAIEIVTGDDEDLGVTDPGVMAWVTGWGLTAVSPDQYAETLQKVQLPIVSKDVASKIWSNIPDNIIMAGYEEYNKDACSGDSGGPMTVKVDGEYKIAGIVSWGDEDCGTYGAYTQVSQFEDWIRDKTGIEERYKPTIPNGQSFFCQGQETSSYYTESITEATEYEWVISPELAGRVIFNEEEATAYWNDSYFGMASVKVRATIDGQLSRWSGVDVEIAANTDIFNQSPDTTICERSPVVFDISANGHNLQYDWYRDDQLIQSEKVSRLGISRPGTNHSGVYVCVVSGECGTSVSEEIIFDVLPSTAITRITNPEDKVNGESIIFDVEAKGHELTYLWFKNDTLIDGLNTSSFKLGHLNATDIGLYQAQVDGTCGSVLGEPLYLYVDDTRKFQGTNARIWPTIGTGLFKIALNSGDVFTVKVINTQGKMVKNIKHCRYGQDIDLTNEPSGIYFIHLESYHFSEIYRIVTLSY